MNIDRARSLFWENFGNYSNMVRNGEYEEYASFKISKETEYEWSIMLMSELVESNLDGDKFSLFRISRLALPIESKVDSFRIIASSNVAEATLEHTFKMRDMIDPEVYDTIIQIFLESKPKT